MKWIAIAVLVLLVGLIALVGSRLPRDHVASRTLRLHKTPQEVWAALTQVIAASSVPVDVVEQDPPRRMVTRVKATEKMFGGTWTIAIAPVPDPSAGSGQAPSAGSGREGCTLTVTEHGWVANPIFRFVSRFVMGHHATIDGVLKQVAAKLGEEPALTGE